MLSVTCIFVSLLLDTPVDMGSKMKCFIVTSIFSIFYQLAFGCNYNELNCTLQVHCSGDDDIILLHDIKSTDDSYCIDLMISYGWNRFFRTQLFITGLVNDDGNLPPRDHDAILQALIALHITNSNLQITPTLNMMENLEILSLSNNNLQVANLFNEVELINLQDIDLSHNFISSIQIDENKHVYQKLRKVNLSHNVLLDISDGVFDSFRDLEILDLSYNNLVKIGYYTFEGLNNLKYLFLSHNKITDINSSLFRLVYLEELYLDNNDIENLLSRNFDKLERLQKLDLEFNKISRINKDTFNGTVSLTTLKLRHNLLNYINKDAFISTNYLKYVDVSSNLLKTLPKYLFRNKSISSFSITENNLEGTLTRGIFEGMHVTELDISFQRITTIEKYAFFGLEKLKELFLNNNRIRTISMNAFMTLNSLNQLDLSNNFITNLDFDTKDLLSLQSLSLGNNFIEQIRHENFRYLTKLYFLNLANNNITKLEPNSFVSGDLVESFQIFHNPLNGTLLKDTFNGLSSVPVLDLSHTLLTKIQNESFSGMFQMQDLNISRSLINILEYNGFMNTGSLKLIDLSYNKLTEFFVNTNDLKNLTTIFLNDNQLIHISYDCFKGMSLLHKVVVSHNSLQNVDYDAFTEQTELTYLDLSLNSNLTFYISVLNNSKNLDMLIISGIESETDFTNIKNVPLKYLEISNSYILNVSKIHINVFKYLTDLILTQDNIVKIEPNTFRNLNVLERLDLSFNNISFVQPGSFKDNILLYKLNLSHNFITILNYGMFRGLVNLNILDVSFNNIRDLKRERFYDLPNINTLLIDHNQLTDVDNDFFDIDLRLLSIGNNPLPCEKIVHMKKIKAVNVSAINIDEHNGDNIDGIVCNVYNNVPKVQVDKTYLKDKDNIFIDIKEVLLNLSKMNQDNQFPPDSGNSDLLKIIINKMDKYVSDQIRGEIQLQNITSQLTQFAGEGDRTNSILERILKAILGLQSLQSTSVTIPTNNFTANINNISVSKSNEKLKDVISVVRQNNEKLFHLQNIISEIDKKISGTLSKSLASDKLNTSSVIVNRNSEKSFVFLEVCVSLILIILVCFILYKFYQSKMFVSNSRSLCTQHITDAMDNSNL